MTSEQNDLTVGVLAHRPWRGWSPGLRIILALARHLRRGSLHLRLPDGTTRSFRGDEPGPEASLRLANGSVARRYLLGGSVGFAEGYIAGDWDCDDLPTLLELLDRNQDAWGRGYHGSRPHRWLRRLQHALHGNDRQGSRRNIHAHYDLGNAFFDAWLDPSMLYSAARFETDEEALEQAQLNKCRRLARLIGLAPGHRLLEIGSGWGAFAILAAREFGARVTSVTVSPAQHELAQQRVFEAGLAERVEIRLQDYRDVSGRFDRLASIEMFEAVGERYWPTFFAKLRSSLTPDGRAGLQMITLADRHFADYRRSPDFIQRYVFPGGMLPSPTALAREYAAAGLEPVTTEAFGADYARTLGIWRERFQAAWHDITGLGFDERFRRIWHYYLAYCEAGFRTGSIDVVQTVLRPS